MAIRVLGSRLAEPGAGSYSFAAVDVAAWTAVGGSSPTVVQDMLSGTRAAATSHAVTVFDYKVSVNSVAAFADVPNTADVSSITLTVLQRVVSGVQHVANDFDFLLDGLPAAGLALTVGAALSLVSATVNFFGTFTGADLKAVATWGFRLRADPDAPREVHIAEAGIRVTFAPAINNPIILNSNQPARMTCRAGKGRTGVMRAAAAFGNRRNLIPVTGINAWTRARAINPAHNAVPQSASWTTFRSN